MPSHDVVISLRDCRAEGAVICKSSPCVGETLVYKIIDAIHLTFYEEKVRKIHKNKVKIKQNEGHLMSSTYFHLPPSHPFTFIPSHSPTVISFPNSPSPPQTSFSSHLPYPPDLLVFPIVAKRRGHGHMHVLFLLNPKCF